jgi:hypothetical protein
MELAYHERQAGEYGPIARETIFRDILEMGKAAGRQDFRRTDGIPTINFSRVRHTGSMLGKRLCVRFLMIQYPPIVTFFTRASASR